MKKRILATLLGVALIFTTLPAIAFAADTTTKVNYVSLGDSTASGYGLDSYLVNGELPAFGGYKNSADDSYASLLKKQIESNGVSVSMDQLAIEGMRSEELHFLLDSTYRGDNYLKEVFYKSGGKLLFNKIATKYYGGSLTKFRQAYKNSITNADVITYKLGTNNYMDCLNFLLGKTKTANNPSSIKYDGKSADTATFKKIKDDFEDKIYYELKNSLYKGGTDSTTRNAIVYYLKNSEYSSYITQVAEAGAYAYMGCIVNFDENIKHIRAINPDAKLVVMGIDNPFEDIVIDLSVEDIPMIGSISCSLDVGELFGKNLIDKTNDYIKNSSAYKSKYVYIDVDDAELLVEEAENGNVTDELRAFYSVYEKSYAIEKNVKAALGNKYTDAALENAYAKLAKATQASAKTENLSYSGAFTDANSVGQMINDTNAYIVNIAVTAAKEKAGMPVSKSSDKLLEEFTNGIYKSIYSIEMRLGLGGRFFQHPSKAGHQYICNAVSGALSGNNKIVRTIPAVTANCGTDGHPQYYLDVVSGYWSTSSNFSNAKPYSQISTIITPKNGEHTWKYVIDKKAAFCKDGAKHLECSVCHEKQASEVIPGKGPAGVKISRVKAAVGKITLSWKLPTSANLKKTTGYEIAYKSDAMEDYKIVSVTKNKTKSKVISGLESGAVYTVKIRTYKAKSGKRYYSNWSAAKTVTVK